MDMVSLASAFPRPQSRFNSAELCPSRPLNYLNAIHPRWDLELPDEPCFLLPELSVSDVSECSERSWTNEYHSPGPRLVILLDPIHERSTLYDACISPTSTMLGSVDIKSKTLQHVPNRARRRPSVAKLVAHMATTLTQRIRKILIRKRISSATVVERGPVCEP